MGTVQPASRNGRAVTRHTAANLRTTCRTRCADAPGGLSLFIRPSMVEGCQSASTIYSGRPLILGYAGDLALLDIPRIVRTIGAM